MSNSFLNKVFPYFGAVIAAGFLYGLTEGILAKIRLLGGVTPPYDFIRSVINRCIFYTLFLTLLGLAIWLLLLMLRRLGARRIRVRPSRAAAAAIFACPLAANAFWTVLAITKLKRFQLWGHYFNVWEPASFFKLLFPIFLLGFIIIAATLYVLFGKLKDGSKWARYAAAPALLGWTALLTAATVQRVNKPRAAADYPDVVFITLDTWRADTLGPRNGGRTLTPNIDGFAKSAVVFRQARSQASWTLASFASIFTSQYPAVHGAAARRPLGTSQPTLAEILAAAGYDTRAVVANELCLPFTGVTRGFGDYHYWNTVPWLKAIGYYDTYAYYPAFRKGREEKRDSRITVRLTDAALDRLERRGRRPYFLWLHYLDPHGPFWPPGEFLAASVPGWRAIKKLPRKKKGKYIRARYDGEVRYVDHEVDRILKLLARRPKTVVIISSDHGEEFLEHGGFGHGHTVYEELLRVPLIMKLPGRGPAFVDTPVETLDIAPTVLNYLGINIPPSMQGRSLLPVIAGREGERPSFAGPTQLYGSKKETVFYQGHKLIHDYRPGVAPVWYDIAEDPGENLGRAPGEAEGVMLQKMLAAWRQNNRKFAFRYRAAAENDALRDALKAMGYVK